MQSASITLIIIWVVIWVIIWYLIARIYFFLNVQKQRNQAVSKSRSVLLGNINEKILPLLPNFPYHTKDLVFLGKWVDYIVLDWLSEGYLKEIVFLEVKTGTSNLNRNEAQIKDCINRKAVKYDIRRK
jgi:predicted Holliday junction resolvase-like endonuclease